MRAQYTHTQTLGGIDYRDLADKDTALDLCNVVWDKDTNSWSNALGYSPFLPGNNLQWVNRGSVLSLYNYRRNGSSILLVELSDGTLNTVVKGALTTIQQGRIVPGNSDPHTTYTTFGRYVLFANGYNRPQKYRGTSMQDLGWYRLPHPPTPRAQRERTDTSSSGATAIEGTATYIAYTTASAWNFEIGPDEQGSQDTQGLGSKENLVTNKYLYRVSFVNEAGSESPLSPISPPVVWTTKSYRNGASASIIPTRAVQLYDLPTGPEGTVARRIYRTRRLDQSATGGRFYYVDTVHDNTTTTIVDYRSDDELGEEAPADTASVLMPAPAARFVATYKNCVFLDGGRTDPSRVYYSEPLTPDTFSRENVLDTGTRLGGEVTAIVSYADCLLIFRENAIDYVTGTPGKFHLSNLRQGLGTLASHSVQVAPGLGVLFLGTDNSLWAVHISSPRSTTTSTPTLSLTKVSEPVDRLLHRVNTSLIQKTTAQYVPAYNEYWLQYPADNPVPDKTLVLHLDNAAFSRREDFPVSCMTTTDDGHLLFGTYESITNMSPATANTAGIFIVNGKRTAGVKRAVADPLFQYVDKDPLTSIVQCQTQHMGADFDKKLLRHIQLLGHISGNGSMSLTVDTDVTVTTHSFSLQPSEQQDYPVYGVDALPAVFNRAAANTFRVDVATPQFNTINWKLSTQVPFRVYGSQFQFAVTGQNTLRSRHV